MYKVFRNEQLLGEFETLDAAKLVRQILGGIIMFVNSKVNFQVC